MLACFFILKKKNRPKEVFRGRYSYLASNRARFFERRALSMFPTLIDSILVEIVVAAIIPIVYLSHALEAKMIVRNKSESWAQVPLQVVNCRLHKGQPLKGIDCPENTQSNLQFNIWKIEPDPHTFAVFDLHESSPIFSSQPRVWWNFTSIDPPVKHSRCRTWILRRIGQ